MAARSPLDPASTVGAVTPRPFGSFRDRLASRAAERRAPSSPSSAL